MHTYESIHDEKYITARVSRVNRSRRGNARAVLVFMDAFEDSGRRGATSNGALTMASIRRASVDDAAAIAAIYDPIVVETCVSFEELPPGPNEMRRRITALAETYPWLVAERAGRVVGYAYAGQHRARAAYRWSVDVSVYVAADARRCGIARSLYDALFETLATQGFCAAFAGITLPNDASCRLHERAGFVRVGIYQAVGFKFGAWHDTAWYERRLRPIATVPTEPTPMSGHDR